jgi:hypothetical protein
MSDAWEVASRYEFNRELKHYPEYAQILSILSDVASVRKSSKLYTGAMGVARILWGHREVVEDILKREIELEKALSEDPRMDPVLVAMEREQVAGTIEWRKGSFQSMTESLRQLFVDLYRGGTRIDPPTVAVHRAARLVTIQGPRGAGAGSVGGLTGES